MTGNNANTENTNTDDILIETVNEIIRGDTLRVKINTTHGDIDIYRNGCCGDILVVKTPTGKVFLKSAFAYSDAEGGLTISARSTDTTAFWSLEAKYYSYVTYY